MFFKQKQPSYSVVFETSRLARRLDSTHSINKEYSRAPTAWLSGGP